MERIPFAFCHAPPPVPGERIFASRQIPGAGGGSTNCLFLATPTSRCVEEEDGVLLINPGSITQPRGFTVPTYAVLEKKDGKIKVVLFLTHGTPITERGFEGELS